MELTYTKVGDYYIPDLALDNDAEYEIGIYGRMRQRFFNNSVCSGPEQFGLII